MMGKTANVYRTEYNLVQYNDYNYCIEKIKYCRQSGFELISNGYAFNSDDVIGDPLEIERVSLSRTKRRLKEICLCNDFTHFLTITINSDNCDRFSLDECQDLLKKCFKAIRRKYVDFRYVVITEKHKDGAFHFHGLIKGLSLHNGLEYNINNHLTIPIVSDRIGFDSVKKLDLSEVNAYQKVCSYIMKYISKDMIKKYNGLMYFCSKGLKRADRYIIKDLPNNINWDFENDFVAIKNFNYNPNTLHTTNEIDFTIISEKKLLDFFKK